MKKDLSKEEIEDLEYIALEVFNYFVENAGLGSYRDTIYPKALKKTVLWFLAENPHLGNVSPAFMVKFGRVKKLREWVDAARQGEGL